MTRLIETRIWKHPGEAALTRVVPWFEDPLDFLAGPHEMECQSSSLDHLAADDETARLFRLARGPAGLPWLDIGNAYFIAVCHYAGDDTAIALDYRTDPADPRVVGSDLWTVPGRYRWRTITDTFSAFAVALGLDPT
ncbi:hypothetical protein GCM10009531_53810 [Actinoplanes capillaceus]